MFYVHPSRQHWQTVVWFLIAGMAMTLMFSVGCVNIKKPYLHKDRYVLDVERQGSRRTPSDGTVLKIHNMRVAAVYQGKEFVYQKDNVTYESDYYNVFFISPGALIAEETRQWLVDAGLFDRVVDICSRIQATHILEGTVTALHGDYSRRDSPRAVLGIVFTLIDDADGFLKIAFQKEYEKEVALENTTPQALVKSWNIALQEILAEFENDLDNIEIPAKR